MKKLLSLAFAMSLVSTELFAMATYRQEDGTSLVSKAPVTGVRLAQNAAGAKEKGRKKILTGEARSKGASTKTNIDFDAASIDGERRIPAGVAIGGAKQDHEHDLITLRLRWHPEMIKSTSNLETGKGP